MLVATSNSFKIQGRFHHFCLGSDQSFPAMGTRSQHFCSLFFLASNAILLGPSLASGYQCCNEWLRGRFPPPNVKLLPGTNWNANNDNAKKQTCGNECDYRGRRDGFQTNHRDDDWAEEESKKSLFFKNKRSKQSSCQTRRADLFLRFSRKFLDLSAGAEPEDEQRLIRPWRNTDTEDHRGGGFWRQNRQLDRGRSRKRDTKRAEILRTGRQDLLERKEEGEAFLLENIFFAKFLQIGNSAPAPCFPEPIQRFFVVWPTSLQGLHISV